MGFGRDSVGISNSLVYKAGSIAISPGGADTARHSVCSEDALEIHRTRTRSLRQEIFREKSVIGR
jgi:hypothetical protein